MRAWKCEPESESAMKNMVCLLMLYNWVLFTVLMRQAHLNHLLVCFHHCISGKFLITVTKRNKTICLCCRLTDFSHGKKFCSIRRSLIGCPQTTWPQVNQWAANLSTNRWRAWEDFRKWLIQWDFNKNVWLTKKAENSSKNLRCERGWSSTLVSFWWSFILTVLINGCQSWKLTSLWRIKVFVFIPYIPSPAWEQL